MPKGNRDTHDVEVDDTMDDIQDTEGGAQIDDSQNNSEDCEGNTQNLQALDSDNNS